MYFIKNNPFRSAFAMSNENFKNAISSIRHANTISFLEMMFQCPFFLLAKFQISVQCDKNWFIVESGLKRPDVSFLTSDVKYTVLCRADNQSL